MKTVTAISTIGVALMLSLTGKPSMASIISDDFDTTHDYLVDGVSGSSWAGVLNSASASALNASTTNAGQLTITTNGNTTAWDGNGQSGPYLYQNVTGDFVATVTVAAGDAANYNVASLIARDPSAATSLDENFFAANYNFFGSNPGVQRRNINKGSVTKFDSTSVPVAAPVLLRITRVDDSFTASYSTNSGVDWIDMAAATTKADMPDTIQIGLAAANYGANSFSVVFDDFSLAAVPEPGSMALMLMGTALLFRRRR